MKKLYMLVIAVIISVASQAQITITSTNTPTAGTQVFYSYMNIDTTGAAVQAAKSGANQTWDFSQMKDTTTYVWSYVNPVTTPWAPDYTGETLAQGLDSAFDYYEVGAGGYYFLGGENKTAYTSYSNKKTLLTFPFTYNTTFNDTYDATVAGGLPSTITGTTGGSGDSYGTLKLPGGTYNNTLRVAVTDNSSQNLPTVGVIFYYTSSTYYWYDASNNLPLFYYVFSTTSASFDPVVHKSIALYLLTSNPTNINKENESISLNLYPNPTNNNTPITLSYSIQKASDVVISVFNNIGQEVSNNTFASQIPGNHIENLQLENLSKGIYTVKIQTDNSFVCKKLVIQ